MKNKIEKKHVKVVDMVLVVGSILILLGTLSYYEGLIGQQSVSLSPLDGFQTENRFVLFEFENAKTILIDDNIEFSSPEKYNVKNNFVINLKPGKYYWKLEGNKENSGNWGTFSPESPMDISERSDLINRNIHKESEIRQFTIESEVSLKLRDKGEGKYEIVNAGNENLDVDVYQFGKLKENVVLDVYGKKEVSGDKFIGGQNG